MLVEPTITPAGLGAWRLAWTGNAGATVRIYLNGLLAFGPVAIATAVKEVVLSPPDPWTVEVHENAAEETVPAAGIALERKPLIWWSSVAGAVEYRMFVAGVLVATVVHEAWRLHHQVVLAADVRVDGGAWAELEVRAIAANGETASTTRPIFVPGAPLEPVGLEVTGGAGVFDLTVVL